jgi:hypothetical protein
MRNPLSKAYWSIGFAVLGAVMVVFAATRYEQIGSTVGTIIGVIGLTMAMIFLFTFLWALLSAFGFARLMSGKGVIARWHLTAAEWDRFRAFDELRSAEQLYLRNDVRIRKETPPGGLDVIVGEGSIIVDDSYHRIAGKSLDRRQINWVNAPVDPECIEFPKSYPRSKGGSVDLTVRVPVPASAREAGVRVFEHYRPK